MVRSQPNSGFSELVAPAIHTEIPYRMHSDKIQHLTGCRSSFIKSCFLHALGFTIRIEAATPTSSSTRGVFSTAIRIFLLKCPRTLGLASSSTIPDTCNIRRTLMACSGLSNALSIFLSLHQNTGPPHHPRHLHRSPRFFP